MFFIMKMFGICVAAMIVITMIFFVLAATIGFITSCFNKEEDVMNEDYWGNGEDDSDEDCKTDND